ncbi:sulfate/molybdate ABC transporter ATP-binding protein [Pseudochelatococcus sp. G4_1912]|uniref:sulfate/molybdate ABC transporter ATP-binding protein n=1 Tax=Pseudochelatococcus sp. G4_1912 TaxID=3114288 RepID=UPI0039C5B3A4
MGTKAPGIATGAVGIRVSGIEKYFEGTTAANGARALRGVDLAIQPGELVALLGPSGSGKTTLLRIIAGLEFATAGNVFFGAEDATHLTVQQRRVGFVFQHYALFKHLSVADNIAYGLNVRPRAERPSSAIIKQRVADLIDLVQLSDLGGRYPAQLSGGQRQRVALARALAVEPRVLLLDEPFGALDAKVRKDLRRWLRDIHDRTGHTTVFVTHDQDEALELADRVAILNNGRIEQVGTPDDIYENPASPFVLSFLGDTVSLPVDVRERGVWLAGDRLDVDASGAEDGRADLFLRPNEVFLTGPEVGIPGIIVSLRRTVSGRRAEVRVALSDTLIEVDVPSEFSPAVNDRVGLVLKKARLFSAP